MTCQFTELDGSYVLGSLSSTERANYERHLDDCDECARNVRELAGLPGLLARVPEDVALDGMSHEEPPSTLLPTLQQEVRSRTRARRVVALAVAAAVVIAGGAVTALFVTQDGDGTPPPAATSTAPPVKMDSEVPEAISGWASLTKVGWGTRIDLTCTYGSYAKNDWVYVMKIGTTQGETHEVGTWKATPGSEAHVSMATSATPDEIASVVVETMSGTPILRLEP